MIHTLIMTVATDHDINTTVLKSSVWKQEVQMFMNERVKDFYFENVIEEGYADSWDYEDYYNSSKDLWCIFDFGLKVQFEIIAIETL